MRRRRFAAAVMAAALMAAALAGCGDAGSSKAESKTSGSTAESAAESAPAEESSEAEKQPETEEEWHLAMLKKSLCSMGDTTKLKEKIAKAENGEKVTMAYLGGSITEGISAGDELCYAKLSYEHFKSDFGKGDNVEYVNAGISGTPSKLGNMRLQRDVLCHEPDICFVEFAVNDGSDDEYQAAYESIVRDLIEKDCAVILLFSVTAEDYSAQDYMKKIGEYYGLPMISYCDALRYMFENGKMKWEDFSDDKSHPNVQGHAIVAEMIDYFFTQAAALEARPVTVPAEPLSIMVQQGMELLENDGIKPESLGSWKEGTSTAHFTKGWTYEPGGNNEPLVFKFKGKFAHIVFKEVSAGKFGSLHVKITCDGKAYDEKDIKTKTKDGWGGPNTALLGMQVAEKEYTLEISMAEGSEDLNAEILALAHN